MSSVAVTIQELFESGQSPSKICNFLQGRESRSGVYKVIKRLEEAGLALPNVRSTPSRKVRMAKSPERRWEEISDETCKKWLLLLVWPIERCRLCLRMIWTCPPTRLPRLNYCLKPQRLRDSKEQSLFWRIWGMAGLVDRWEVIHYPGSQQCSKWPDLCSE